jgi:predicted Fe-S protein YdhL (DUF1289 family)
LVVAFVLIAGCARTSVDRAHWQRMSPTEKTLYVRSLLGHEQAKESKGGNPLIHPREAEEYVHAIDAAYTQGDTREPDRVFESMGTARR